MNSTNVLSSHWFCFVWLACSGNKFFRVGPNISEKCVPGGTNFRGVKIKRDSSTCSFVSWFCHRTWQLLASQARPFTSSADRFQYPPCDDRVDKIRVDSTWQHVHMQTCCMWDQGSEVDLLVHTKSCQSCACHRTA